MAPEQAKAPTGDGGKAGDVNGNPSGSQYSTLTPAQQDALEHLCHDFGCFPDDALLFRGVHHCWPWDPQGQAIMTGDNGRKTESKGPTVQAPVQESEEPEELQKDYGHAYRLSGYFSDCFRWAVHLGTWMEWTGQVWRPVPEEPVVKMASDVLRAEYVAQLAAAERSDIPRLAALLRDACTYARMVAALSFLKGWDGIMTRPEEWDATPWVLNVANGLLDLRTGELRPHSPTDLCTKLASVDYDPAAKGERWQAHLDRFLPDPDIQRQVQRDLGLSLTGAVLDELLPIWYGTGANGKTTTARALLEVMGDYSLRAAPDLLVRTRNERHPTEVADLAGSRMVFSVEVDEGKKLAEALVKDMTGGDKKKARKMRQDFYEFDQTWYITLIVNHKPIITGTDEGIWRRVRLIPWQVRIPTADRRPQDEVVAELLADGSGVLNWLLAGLRDWQADHHWIAPEVQAVTEAYRAEQDVLGGFLQECCELGPRYSVPVAELYEAYATWCTTASEEPQGKTNFSKLLRQRGMGQRREAGTGARRWVGIRLSTTVTKCDKVSGYPHENDKFPDEPENVSHFVTPFQGRPSGPESRRLTADEQAYLDMADAGGEP